MFIAKCKGNVEENYILFKKYKGGQNGKAMGCYQNTKENTKEQLWYFSLIQRKYKWKAMF